MTKVADLTWPEVDALRHSATVLLVPLGSTEQHGPHLPLSTDTDIALALSSGAAACDADVVVAPALAVTSSGEHQGFAGTLSIGAEVTEALLVELARSAVLTFDVVVFVSTHGGNAIPVSRAVASFAGDDEAVGQVRSWSPDWDAYLGDGGGRAGTGEEGDLHAGRVETSLMLAIAPERVRLADAAAGTTRPVRTLMPVLRRVGVRAVSPNGVLGDPTGASAAEGRSLLEAAVDDLAGFVLRCRRGGHGDGRSDGERSDDQRRDKEVAS